VPTDNPYGEAGPALLSPDRVYRYTLERIWDPDRPQCAFIGLNPSTADESQLDPTLRRCVRFADGWGYGSFVMLNVFAFRSTDWRGLIMARDPVGPANWVWIGETTRRVVERGGIIVCCWGAHVKDIPNGQTEADTIRSLLDRPYYIRMTESGFPGHPLYLPSRLEPTPWT
jgi:hypothetical protein